MPKRQMAGQMREELLEQGIELIHRGKYKEAVPILREAAE
jgi:hypothetical protein